MADDNRIQVRLNDDMAEWLDGRTERMHTGSRHQQALTELVMWRSLLEVELRRIQLTLKQAFCVADVCNGWLMDAAISTRPGLVYAECYDAFRLARQSPGGEISSYGAKYNPEVGDTVKWEQDLLDYLGGLGPAADHALRDAIVRWWHLPDDEPLPENATDAEIDKQQIARFKRVGLRVTA